MSALTHEPILKDFEGGTIGVSCECGWLDPYLWGHQVGARTAYLEHVVRAHFPASWPGTFAVEYDDEGRLS